MTKELFKKAQELIERIDSIQYGLTKLDDIPRELAKSVVNRQNRMLDSGEAWRLDLTAEDFTPLMEKKRQELKAALAEAEREFSEL